MILREGTFVASSPYMVPHTYTNTHTDNIQTSVTEPSINKIGLCFILIRNSYGGKDLSRTVLKGDKTFKVFKISWAKN